MKRGQNVGKMEGRTNKCVGLVAPCRAGVEGGVWLVPVPNGGCRWLRPDAVCCRSRVRQLSVAGSSHEGLLIALCMAVGVWVSAPTAMAVT